MSVMTLLEFQTPGNHPVSIHSAHERPRYQDFDAADAYTFDHSDLDFEPDFETSAQLVESRLAWQALARKLQK